MKRGLLFISFAFSISLALILGLRISSDALAVIIGVILGVLASLPTTLLLVFVSSRQQNKLNQPPYPPGQHPPVVVINASDKPPAYAPSALPPAYPANGTRRWTVIGDEETDSIEIKD